MHRVSGFSLILMAVAMAAMAQGKILVDPNIPRLPSITAAEAPTTGDVRLDQKITYQGGYKRLDAVVSELSSISGVHLNCGKNSQDWQVQDIPVVAYAQDMPLGKLLRAVADGSHTLLTRLIVGSDEEAKEPSYRICRDSKSVDSIVALMRAQYYAKFADAEWGWDALQAFGKDPNLDRSNLGRWAPGFSSVLAYLGEEGKKRVFSGESIILNTETAPQIAGALRELYKQHAPADCLPEDLKKSEMVIGLSIVGDSDLQYLGGDWTWHTADGRSSSSGYPISRCAEALKNVKGFSLSPRPASELPAPEEDYPKDRLRLLKSQEDWELPVLKTKINLEAPVGNERPSFSDAVIAIAKASGFNIVCEDFQSHQDSQYNPRADQFFTKDTTLGEALKKLNCYKPSWLNDEGEYAPTWMIDEKDKLIVGWAHEWREHHYHLVPESLIAGLREKMNGKGAQFDDIVPIVSLTRRQRLEWISHTQDISPADCWEYVVNDDAGSSGWRLYAALGDSDKALAKSDGGLPLAKLDPVWLTSFFSPLATSHAGYYLPDAEKSKEEAAIQLKKEFLTDPKLITTLVMRMRRVDWQHSIEFCGEKSGEKVVLKFAGPRRAFPMFSPERMAELNTGSRVRTMGTVTLVGDGYLYLQNGSGIRDGTSTGVEENIGVRIICNPSGYKPGDTIEVTGTNSTLKTPSGRTAACIDARGAGGVKRVK